MIREFRAEDAVAGAALMRETAVDWTGSPQGLLHRLTSHPVRARQASWLAEEGGEVVGIGRARMRWEVSASAVGTFWVGVRGDRHGRGVGSELFDQVERHLMASGAEVLESFADEEDGRRFLERRGFGASGGEHLFVLDVPAADLGGLPRLEEAKAQQGLVIAALGDVLDWQRELHVLYAAASADIPEDFTVDDIRYDEWTRECLSDPDLSHDGSAVVLHEGRPVAFAFLVADGEGHAANEMTGTSPAFRRRGLARLAKLATIRWAARNDVATIVTGNDDDNEAMLALNRSLGYLPLAERTFYFRAR